MHVGHVSLPGDAPPTSDVPAGLLELRAPDARRDAAVFEAISTGRSRCAQVSGVLDAAFQIPPGRSASGALTLASTERQLALMRLALSYGQWPVWFTCACVECGDLIDLKVSDTEFAIDARVDPVPPSIDVQPDDAPARTFSVPSGFHEQLAETDADDPTLAVLRSCDRTGPEIGRSEASKWLDALDVVLSRHLSKAETELVFACPHCGGETSYWFDPLDWIARYSAGCFEEVHDLAAAYGWSEDAILSMTASRRRIYLSMVRGTG